MSMDCDSGNDAGDGDGDGHGRDHDRLAREMTDQGNAENSGPDVGHDDQPYEVGYGRPPKHSQVAKGQVLNPIGRPRGSMNRTPPPSSGLYSIILEEARRMIPVPDANGEMSMQMARAIVRSTNVVAAKGNTRGQRLATDLIETAELETKRERDREIEVALDYKRAWNQELARRKGLRIKGPPPLPHPYHLVIDLARGCVWIKGPATTEEKAAWLRWERYRDDLMAYLRDHLAERHDPNCPDPNGLEEKIEGTKGVLEIIGYALDGNRDAMGFLEEVFAKLRRTEPDFFDEPKES